MFSCSKSHHNSPPMLLFAHLSCTIWHHCSSVVMARSCWALRTLLRNKAATPSKVIAIYTNRESKFKKNFFKSTFSWTVSYLCLQSTQDLHKNLMKAKLNWESRLEIMLEEPEPSFQTLLKSCNHQQQSCSIFILPTSDLHMRCSQLLISFRAHVLW